MATSSGTAAKPGSTGGPVLELGAGTGRITLPVAQQGLSVHALDAHPGMLDALRRKTSALPREVRELITITEGDMRRFRLDRTFSFVIIPFRAFLHNLTADDQLACLQCVREHLVPGGRLAFNVFHPSLEFMAQHAGPLAEYLALDRLTSPQPEGVTSCARRRTGTTPFSGACTRVIGMSTTTRTALSREPSSITWSCHFCTHPTSGSCWSAVVSMPSKSPVTSTVARFQRKTPDKLVVEAKRA